MAVIRALARPMLASMFVIGGLDSLRNPNPKIPAAEKVVGELTEQVPELTEKIPMVQNTKQLVLLDGAVKVVAGSLLALGKLPRLSALALAAGLIPTTLAGHRFWEEKDPTKRAGQKVHFFKNVSMLGGLVIAAVDTGGKPDLVWRAGHASKALGEKVQAAKETVEETVDKALHH